jgi:23S rRNA (adenine-N6)-dimethyltransferase
LAAAGARVLAVELHPVRAERLRRRFADQPLVTVLERDLQELRLPRSRFRVVANPPWALAKPIIRMLTGPDSSLLDAHLLLQRGLVADFGRRGTAGPGARQRYLAEYALGLPRYALQPPPPGPAAWLRLTGPSHRPDQTSRNNRDRTGRHGWRK